MLIISKNEYITANPLDNFHSDIENAFPGDFSFINDLRSPSDSNNNMDIIFSELHRELFIDIDDIILSNRMRFFSAMDDHLLFGIDYYM